MLSIYKIDFFVLYLIAIEIIYQIEIDIGLRNWSFPLSIRICESSKCNLFFSMNAENW